MQYMKVNDLRKKFLDFFESKGHLKLPSFSLIPKDDNSLLLINSGMAPMKKYFTGEVTPPKTRVTTCQKCIRTPDIERVGVTARHITYFEMLGNFSFGDYFKNEITAWAWEFCTEVLKLPKDKLWISIYENDDETFEIWTKKVGVDPSHIVRLGKEDNFWEHGQGPCGPCSELYFDRGEKYSCGSPTCTVGCDCDRYVEFWNLVFTQFENDGNGNYSNLDHPNIDTGMGLERLACIMQGVDNVFLIDTMQNIMDHVSKIAGVKYGDNKKSDRDLRIITDHIRSTTVMIADGIMPSNEGRGYVLRRLLRRAARHGKLLGINTPFLYKVCDTVINENKEVYPELIEKRDFIKTLIKVEEENFSKTIDQGLLLLNDFVSKSKNKILSGEDAFKLHDTYGFPLDLTKEILAEKNMSVDEAGFKKLLEEQKNRARNARQNSNFDAWKTDLKAEISANPTVFCGYETLSTEAKVVCILNDKGKNVENAGKDDIVSIIFDKTPCYAQSGGQVGDVGILKNDKCQAQILETSKNSAGVFLHKVKILNGSLSASDTVSIKVDEDFRSAVARNHSAAHLLQAALRNVLGNHVEQAGQLVNNKIVRFDFTHFSALSTEQLAEVEKLVNQQILSSLNCQIDEMALDEAKKLGAMALFGEKYGKTVRVVKFGDFSLELCGGTHVKNTSQIGLFKIISENSVASGVRRIEAVTALNVLNLLNEKIEILRSCSNALKLPNVNDLPTACAKMSKSLKEKDYLIEKLNFTNAKNQAEKLLDKAFDLNGTKIITGKLEDTSSNKLKNICDLFKDKFSDLVVVLIAIDENKATAATCVGQDALKKGFKAGEIVKKVSSFADGNGGGKPDFAMAGIKSLDKIDFALSKVSDVLNEILS